MESDRYQSSNKTQHTNHPKKNSSNSLPNENPRYYGVPHNINIKIPEASHLATVDLRNTTNPQRKSQDSLFKPKLKQEYTEVFWEQINFILTEQGFSPLKLVYENSAVNPDYSSLAETVVNLLNIIISKNNKHQSVRQSQNLSEKLTKLQVELSDSKNSIQVLNEKIKHLTVKLTERKEKIRNLYEKINRSKELHDILETLNSDVRDRPKEIFRRIMHRDYNPEHENDLKTMSVILLYEHQRIDNEHELEIRKINENSAEADHLKFILNKLEVSSPQVAIDVIDKMHKVVLMVPNIERFISSVYRVIFSPDQSQDFQVNMDQIIPTIVSMKMRLISLEILRKNICENFELDMNSADSLITQKSEALNHFNRLFQNSGNEAKTMEEIFIFVHEMKKFIQVNHM